MLTILHKQKWRFIFLAGKIDQKNKRTKEQPKNKVKEMIPNTLLQNNSNLSSYTPNIPEAPNTADIALNESKTPALNFEGMRLGKLEWHILYEIYLITLTCKRDYGYTAKEISDRFKAKGRKYSGLRKVEAALQILQSVLFFVRKTARKYPPQSGKEKFRGAYRELSDMGLAFIKYWLNERVRLQDKQRPAVINAELNAELIAREPYSHVASEPVSKIKILEYRSTLETNSSIHSAERSDFANACFEEYAQQLSNAKTNNEQEVVSEEVYSPLLPNHRPAVKKLLEGSQMDSKAKKEVIEGIHRQQNSSSPIRNITALTKKLISNQIVAQQTKLQGEKNASYRPYVEPYFDEAKLITDKDAIRDKIQNIRDILKQRVIETTVKKDSVKKINQ